MLDWHALKAGLAAGATHFMTDQFELIEVLYRGPHTTALRCRDLRSGAQVVLKKLLPGYRT